MDHWTQPAGRAQAPAGKPPPPQPPPMMPPQRRPEDEWAPPQQRQGEWAPPRQGEWAPPPAGPPPLGGPPPPTSAPPPISAPPPAGMFGPGYPPGQPGAPVAAGSSRRLGWPSVLALVLVVVLTIGVAVQSWLLVGVSSDLDRANQRIGELVQGQEYGGERLDSLEDRATELEGLAGDVFNPEAIADAVLPSVIMVVAGPASGTAFAIGPETGGGGTHLFTNYHVVADVWSAGGRDVTLERTNQSYPAEILDVDEEADVALLQTDSSFRGLDTNADEVRSGEQIIAVGAPLGLTDTVTTGVVSSPAQELPDGTGPWIQFDAAINPGNSGGPVVNGDQEVVGIATAKTQESEGIGFAVPIDVACGLFDVCE